MERTITAAESGQKILKYLLKTSDGTKIFLFKLFRKGEIKVNGKRVEKDYELKSGDLIFSKQLQEHGKKTNFQDVKSDISVLFEDTHLIALDKDDRTLVHAATGEPSQGTLLEQVKAYLRKKGEDYSAVTAVHRIDKNTKGVVIFAKDYTYAKILNERFRDGMVSKTYEALLTGRLEDKLFVEADIIRGQDESGVEVKNLSKSFTVPDKVDWLNRSYKTSKTVSATVFVPVRYLESEDMTLTLVTIWTGRHHQIRAVAQALGHSLVGDRKYPGKRLRMNQGGQNGQALICKRIELDDPVYRFESRYEIVL